MHPMDLPVRDKEGELLGTAHNIADRGGRVVMVSLDAGEKVFQINRWQEGDMQSLAITVDGKDDLVWFPDFTPV